MTARMSLATRSIRETGVEVSVLGFGAAPIGNLYRPRTPAEAANAIDAAWSGGVGYFDTAPHYGLGLSERRLGARLGGLQRSEYVLSTKVGRLLEPNLSPIGSDLTIGGFAVPDDLTRVLDYSADGVRRSIEASLHRLQLDSIDVALVHDPDDHADQAINEAIPALLQLRDEGVIRAVGVGMNQWQIPLRAVAQTDIDVVMIAGRWTLLDRSALPLLDHCAERGVAVLAAAPFNSGLLASVRPAAGARLDYATAPPEMLEKARHLDAVCRAAGVELPAAALQFPLRHPSVVSVVAGFGSAAHVQAALSRMAAPVPDEIWAELDRAMEAIR